MNVIFLSQHCCIRVIKEGLALSQAGHNVLFLQKRIQNDEFRTALPNIAYWDTDYDLRIKLENQRGFDLIHVHNEPSWLGWFAKRVRPDLPVIFDCHDLNSARFGERSDDEKLSIEECDGFVTPSRGYAKHLRDFWSCKKPVQVIYSFVNNMFIQRENSLPKLPGVVYQGGINISDNPHVYRDYRPLADALLKNKTPFHIYGANNRYYNEYAMHGAFVNPIMPYNLLLQQVGRYEWGFVGPANYHPAFRWAMPNKLFEYMAAGIPILAFQCEEAEDFVIRNDVGFVLKDLNDLREVVPEHQHYFKENVLDLREKITMEAQIGELVGFYKKFL